MVAFAGYLHDYLFVTFWNALLSFNFWTILNLINDNSKLNGLWLYGYIESWNQQGFLTGITKNHVYHHMYITYIIFSICYAGYFFYFLWWIHIMTSWNRNAFLFMNSDKSVMKYTGLILKELLKSFIQLHYKEVVDYLLFKCFHTCRSNFQNVRFGISSHKINMTFLTGIATTRYTLHKRNC